jgi:hypothetical protein
MRVVIYGRTPIKNREMRDENSPYSVVLRGGKARFGNRSVPVHRCGEIAGSQANDGRPRLPARETDLIQINAQAAPPRSIMG